MRTIIFTAFLTTIGRFAGAIIIGYWGGAKAVLGFGLYLFARHLEERYLV